MLRHSLRLSLLASALFLLPACGGGGGGSAAASNEEPEQITPTEPLPEGFTSSVFICDGLSTDKDGQPISVRFSFLISGDSNSPVYGMLEGLAISGFDNDDEKDKKFNFEMDLSSAGNIWSRTTGGGGNMQIQLDFTDDTSIVGGSLLVDLSVEQSQTLAPKLLRRGTVKNLEFALKPSEESGTRIVKCSGLVFNIVTYP